MGCLNSTPTRRSHCWHLNQNRMPLNFVSVAMSSMSTPIILSWEVIIDSLNASRHCLRRSSILIFGHVSTVSGVPKSFGVNGFIDLLFVTRRKIGGGGIHLLILGDKCVRCLYLNGQ